METKICSKCHETKPISDFYTSKNGKDGLRSHCKDCHKRNLGCTRQNVQNDGDNPLATFTPRELIIELRRRGYEGELQIIQKIKV